MVSTGKRMRYVSENDFSSSDGEDTDYANSSSKNSEGKAKSSNKKPRWLSKNAIMARENRLKKKLYVSNLENEVTKLKSENDTFSKVVENQSALISDLKKEIKYLKSVISNSTDIGNLIKSIHHSTAKTANS